MKLLALSTLLFCGGLQAAEWKQESTLTQNRSAALKVFGSDSGGFLLDKAQALESKKRYSSAAKTYEDLAEVCKRRHNKAQAIVAAGDNHLLSGDLEKAQKNFAIALDKYPTLIKYKTVVFTQFTIADSFYKEVANKEGFFVNYSKAIKSYKQIVTNAPFDKRSPQALLRVAELQIKDNSKEEAEATYISIIKRYRNHRVTGDARIALAELYYGYAKDTGKDRLYIIKSRNQLSFFKRNYPTHTKKSQADKLTATLNQLEASKLYKLGHFYSIKSHRRLAVSKRYLNQVISKYPKTPAAPKAQALLNKINNVSVKAPTVKAVANAKPIIKDTPLAPEATDRNLRQALPAQQNDDKFLVKPELLPIEKK